MIDTLRIRSPNNEMTVINEWSNACADPLKDLEDGFALIEGIPIRIKMPKMKIMDLVRFMQQTDRPIYLWDLNYLGIPIEGTTELEDDNCLIEGKTNWVLLRCI